MNARERESYLWRLPLAGVLIFCTVNALFATAMTAAYKLGALGIVEGFGRLTPGDDYRRFIPLMEAVPAWIHALWVVAAGLFLVAMAMTLLRKAGAWVPVVVAVAFEAVAYAASEPLLAATGVQVQPTAVGKAIELFLAILVPLGVAAALWLLTPRDQVPGAHAQVM